MKHSLSFSRLRPCSGSWPGVFLGVGLGAIPGLTASTGIALVLPLSFLLDITGMLGLLIGLYKGAVFGGSISAISFAIPGSPDSAATVYDGYKLTKQGKGRKAILIALYSSVTADTLSDIIVILIAPTIALMALQFGPSERLWLMVVAIALLGALSGRHLAKGMLSAGIGLFLGTIGTDPVSNVPRNTFDQVWLRDGLHLVPLVIGIFAMSQMLEQGARRSAQLAEGAGGVRQAWRPVQQEVRGADLPRIPQLLARDGDRPGRRHLRRHTSRPWRDRRGLPVLWHRQAGLPRKAHRRGVDPRHCRVRGGQQRDGRADARAAAGLRHPGQRHGRADRCRADAAGRHAIASDVHAPSRSDLRALHDPVHREFRQSRHRTRLRVPLCPARAGFAKGARSDDHGDGHHRRLFGARRRLRHLHDARPGIPRLH